MLSRAISKIRFWFLLRSYIGNRLCWVEWSCDRWHHATVWGHCGVDIKQHAYYRLVCLSVCIVPHSPHSRVKNCLQRTLYGPLTYFITLGSWMGGWVNFVIVFYMPWGGDGSVVPNCIIRHEPNAVLQHSAEVMRILLVFVLYCFTFFTFFTLLVHLAAWHR